MNAKRQDIIDWLQANAKPEIHIEYTRAKQALPIGASKIGGCPDVPADFVWPRVTGGGLYVNEQGEPKEYEERAKLNRPLTFMAQFDLAEVAEFDQENLLPKAGHLLFFYDYESQAWGELHDKDCAKVFYFPPETPLIRMTVPDDMYEYIDLCERELQLTFSCRHNVPYFDYLPEELQDWEAFNDEDDPFNEKNRGGCKLLGWEDPVQHGIASECALRYLGSEWDDYYNNPEHKTAVEQEAKNWILLFQFDSLYDEGDEPLYPALQSVSPEILPLIREYQSLSETITSLKEVNLFQDMLNADNDGKSIVVDMISSATNNQDYLLADDGKSIFADVISSSGLDIAQIKQQCATELAQSEKRLQEIQNICQKAGITLTDDLFQKNPQYNPVDIMFGDAGCLFYAIRKQDLAAGNFNNVLFIVQSH